MGVNGPSIFRTSRVRRSGAGVGLKFAGRSVKGTRVSPSASAGIAQSGTNASRLAAANPLRIVSLRVMFSGMLRLQAVINQGFRLFYLVGYEIATDRPKLVTAFLEKLSLMVKGFRHRP